MGKLYDALKEFDGMLYGSGLAGVGHDTPYGKLQSAVLDADILLNNIYELLDGKVWDPGTLDAVATLIDADWKKVHEPNEEVPL